MIPTVIAPPALYPQLYRPAAAGLPLPQTLPSVFPAHSSFLVEDLLRISRPAAAAAAAAAAAFANRTVPSSSAALPTTTTTVSFSGAPAERAMTRESCSPKTSSSKDPTFLKFGVSAILAPSPKSGEFDASASPSYFLSLGSDFNWCDVPPQRPRRPPSTACTPRPSPSPALTETFTPYSGRLIYQVGATFYAPAAVRRSSAL